MQFWHALLELVCLLFEGHSACYALFHHVILLLSHLKDGWPLMVTFVGTAGRSSALVCVSSSQLVQCVMERDGVCVFQSVVVHQCQNFMICNTRKRFNQDL
jgi:hypothetical protein